MCITELSGKALIWSKKMEVEEISPLWEMGHDKHSTILCPVCVCHIASVVSESF